MNSTYIKSLSREELENKLKEVGTSTAELNSMIRWKPSEEGLRVHQLGCFYAAVSLSYRYLFLLDMGTGKTLTSLITYMYAKKRGVSTKGAIIIANLSKAIASVTNEIQTRTNYRVITLETKLVKEWKARIANGEAIKLASDVIITTTYMGLLAATRKRIKNPQTGKTETIVDKEAMAAIAHLVDFVIADEIHSARNAETQTVEFLTTLAHYPTIKGCLGLTGTLYGKSEERAFFPFYIVDGGRTFGKSYHAFESIYFTTHRKVIRVADRDIIDIKLSISPQKATMFAERLREGAYTVKIDEVTELPSFSFYIRPYELGGDAAELYLQMRSSITASIRSGQGTSEVQTSIAKCNQVLSGFVYVSAEIAGKVERETVYLKDTAKVDILLDDTEELLQDPSRVVLVYYYLTGSRTILERELKKRGIDFISLVSGDNAKVTAAKLGQIDRFSNGVVLANVASSGTGLNLQRCGAEQWYDPPRDVDMFQQGLARIRRLGTTHSHLQIMIYKGSVKSGRDVLHLRDTIKWDDLTRGRKKSEQFWDIDDDVREIVIDAGLLSIIASKALSTEEADRKAKITAAKEKLAAIAKKEREHRQGKIEDQMSRINQPDSLFPDVRAKQLADIREILNRERAKKMGKI